MTRRLRIAVLSRRFTAAGGGAEGYSVRLAEQLAARHEVHVFAQETAHSWPGVSYHPISTPLKRPRWVNQLWFAWATARATRSGFDIVHSHELTWHGQVQTIHVKPVRYSLLAGVQGAARVLRWLKIVTSPRLLAYLWLEAARFSSRPGRHVVAASSMVQAEALQAYPGAAGMTSVITPGVDLPGEGPGRAEARRALGLPADGRLLLFVANDYARKGLDTLLAALAQLPADVHLAVVGDAAGIPPFARRAAALGEASRVHFLGSLPEVAPAYRAADALVHPTLEDTFAMVVLEAMAHGLPVVVSGPAFCGISALLRDGHDALLLSNPRDPQELVAVLLGLLAGKPSGLGPNALEFAREHGWASVAAAHENLYRKLSPLRIERPSTT
ncbi:MAG: glycosyltransferase family 4 protein [Burkholderiales bacterium]|nr:glycosyltransferase family 4 protein [Burkholderiales bacterium]